MKKLLVIPVVGAALAVLPHFAHAREIVVLPGVVGPTGELSGVDTTGPGTLTVGDQDINTSNDAGGAITTDAANTASIVFSNSSLVTGFTGTVGSTFLDISAGSTGNTVTFNGQVFSTTFSLSGTGTVNFNGGFVSNTGSTMDFAGDGFINVGAGQTVKAAVTNSAGANTGTLTLFANSILDGAVGAASGLKQITVSGGDALITGEANAGIYSLGTNTLNVAGAFKIPVAGVINTTIFSDTVFGRIVPVGAATIGDALQVNVVVTGPITLGTNFDIVDATSGTDGSTVIATDNSLRYLFSAPNTANGLVRITATQIPLAAIIDPIADPIAPVLAPIVDDLPVTPDTEPVLTAITLLPDAAAIADALAQLAPGASNLGAPLASYRVTQQFQDMLNSHLDEARPICGQDGQTDRRRLVRRDDVTACYPDDRHSHWWIAVAGHFGEQDESNGHEGYDTRTYGAILGYERRLNDDMRAGLALTYARSAVDADFYDNGVDIDSYQATAYMRYVPGDWFANVALTYGIDDYESRRHIAFPGFSGTAEADYDGDQITAYGTTGYNFYIDDGRTIFTPMATLQYTRLSIDSYTETGVAGVNLRVQDQDYDFVQSGLGGKISRDLTLSGTQILRPEFHANWFHSFGDETISNTASFTGGGPAFTVEGLSRDRDTYNVGTGVALLGSETWSVEAIYDYQWQRSEYSANQLTLNLVMRL